MKAVQCLQEQRRGAGVVALQGRHVLCLASMPSEAGSSSLLVGPACRPGIGLGVRFQGPAAALLLWQARQVLGCLGMECWMPAWADKQCCAGRAVCVHVHSKQRALKPVCCCSTVLSRPSCLPAALSSTQPPLAHCNQGSRTFIRQVCHRLSRPVLSCLLGLPSTWECAA